MRGRRLPGRNTGYSRQRQTESPAEPTEPPSRRADSPREMRNQCSLFVGRGCRTPSFYLMQVILRPSSRLPALLPAIGVHSMPKSEPAIPVSRVGRRKSISPIQYFLVDGFQGTRNHEGCGGSRGLHFQPGFPGYRDPGSLRGEGAGVIVTES